MLLRIGLGKKAGKIVFGTDAVCDAIREGKMLLVLIASDASENSKKRITNCASYYKVKTETPDGLTTATLGTSIGRSPGTSAARYVAVRGASRNDVSIHGGIFSLWILPSGSRISILYRFMGACRLGVAF